MLIFDGIDNDQVKLFEVATHFGPAGLWLKPWAARIIRRDVPVNSEVTVPRWVTKPKGVADNDIVKLIEIAVRLGIKYDRPFPFIDAHVRDVTRMILVGHIC